MLVHFVTMSNLENQCLNLPHEKHQLEHAQHEKQQMVKLYVRSNPI